MKKQLIYIIVCLAFVSCSEKEERESLNFEDFAGETGVEEEDTLEKKLESAYDLSSNSGQLRDNLSANYYSDSIDVFHLMNRYSFKDKEQLEFTFNQEVPYGESNMVYPTSNFYYYSFSDTNATYNAFYNYIDFIAAEGEGGPIKLNEDVDAIKTFPFFMAVYDTMIVSAEYKCEHQAHSWSDFQDAIFSIYGNDYKYLIEAKCGGPLKWK